MYATLFGLTQEPFSIAPDPRFLYMSERHREALAHLLYGIQGGGGFVLLTGAVGAGKTTVCRCFVDQLPPNCQLAYVFNPQVSAPELLAMACDDFGVQVPAGASTKGYVDALNDFLLTSHAAGRSNVLVIDEAQNLAPEVLEQLRLLTNLETDTRKLLQIILIGQPELRDRLAGDDLSQVAQRVIARYHLDPLEASETAQYVRHRLSVAGLVGEVPFDARALRHVHRHARGVPRRINLLCDRALLGAYAQGRKTVDAAMVDHAAREVFDERPAQQRWPAAVLGAWAAAAVLVGALAWWLAGAPGAPALQASAGEAAGGEPAAAPAGRAATGAAPAAAQRGEPAVNDGAAKPSTTAADGPSPGRLDAAALAQRTSWPDEASAWRALAERWGLAPQGADPCATLATAGVACYRGPATLALVRQLDRPGWLAWQSAPGVALPVLLVGLGERDAMLQLPDGLVSVSLATLASRWNGEFATLWRSPPEPVAGWVQLQLAAEQAGALPADASPRARVEAFQRAQGLSVDGLVGPLTLMQINRAAAVAEPRLTAER
jgi:general secretion pathway protein A